MEIIEGLEPVRRGAYGGAVTIFGFDGGLDSAITIRSLVLQENSKGKRMACVQAGAGLVADSVPETEYLETCNKARAVMLAVSAAEQMGRPALLPKRKKRLKTRRKPRTAEKSGKGR